jgi:hypothetical protein
MDNVERKIPVRFEKLNDFDKRFIQVKIWLMHLGRNHNGSYFSKEAVQSAIPSLANTPILGYVVEKDGELDFSDHRMVLQKNDKGKYELKYIGQAFGVIPESNNAKFETKIGSDGVEREYLTVEGLIWNKWDLPEEILLRDMEKGQSMELHPDHQGFYNKSDRLYHFTDFKFFGACILGDMVKPAMEGADIEVQFSMVDDFDKDIQEQMEQFKTLYSASYQPPQGDDISNKKEGEVIMADKSQILSALTDHQQFSYVSHSEDSVVVFDTNESVLVGFSYATNEDVVAIDFETKAKYTATYSQVEDGVEVEFEFVPKAVVEAQATQFSTEKEALEVQVTEANAKVEAITGELAQAKEQFTAIESEKVELQSQVESVTAEITELQQFKASKLAEEKEAQVEEMFAQFSEQLTEDEIAEAKTQFSQLELTDIEKELYALVGKKAATKFSKKDTKKPEAQKVPVFSKKEDTNGYDYIVEEYLKGSSK